MCKKTRLLRVRGCLLESYGLRSETTLLLGYTVAGFRVRLFFGVSGVIAHRVEGHWVLRFKGLRA